MMKKMKKILCVMLAGVMVLSSVGCVGSKDAEAKAQETAAADIHIKISRFYHYLCYISLLAPYIFRYFKYL